MALGAFGPDAKVAVTSLTEIVKRDDSLSSWNLHELGLSMERPSFESNESAVRADAVEALGLIGPAAKDAIPLLASLLEAKREDEGIRHESDIRCAAALALAGIGPEAASAVPALIRLLDDPHDAAGKPAIEALCAMGPAAKEALPRLLQLRELPSTGEPIACNNVYSAIHRIDSVKLPCRVLKKEIPCDRESCRHYEFSLQIEGSREPIFLARLLEGNEGSGQETIGFDESTLGFEWLEEGRFLHVHWDTLPLGQGIYNMQTHLLVIKDHGRWKQVFRDTQGSNAHRIFYVEYDYTFEPKSQILTIREDDLSGPVSEGYLEPETEPVPVNVLTKHKVVYIHEWRFKLNGSHLDYLDGKNTVDFDEYSNGGNETNEYDIHEVAKFLAPESPDAMVEKLRKLNPALKTSDVCSGSVLFDTDVKWRGADERHYYSM